MPLSPNGKLDRKVLPAPDLAAFSTGEFEPPQGETETRIAAIWQELLGVERVGRHDNFFNLGGNSLLVVKAVQRLDAQGVRVSVVDIFARPTVAGIGAAATLAQPVGTREGPPPVLIRSGTAPEILFLAHDATQSLDYARRLADALPARWTVYGLVSRSGAQQQGQTVPEIAAMFQVLGPIKSR